MLIDRQIKAIEAESKAECREVMREVMPDQAASSSTRGKMIQLTQLKGIGLTGAQVLANEVFYRRSPIGGGSTIVSG